MKLVYITSGPMKGHVVRLVPGDSIVDFNHKSDIDDPVAFDDVLTIDEHDLDFLSGCAMSPDLDYQSSGDSTVEGMWAFDEEASKYINLLKLDDDDYTS